MTLSVTGPPALDRIWLLLQHRRFELAEAAARQRIAADPADWQAFVLLAHALRLHDRLDEAGVAATTAVGLAPAAGSSHFALARVRGQQGRFEQAHEAAVEALRIIPYQADYHGFRAQLFYLRSSYNAAISCAEAGLRQNARHTDCLLWRALAQEAKDQPEGANANFAQLLHLAPDSALLHQQLGKVLLRRHEPHQADEHLSTALRKQPEQAKELLPSIRKARRQATWPAWLLRMARHEAGERALGLEAGLKAAWVQVVAVPFRIRACWLTRHDPLFALTYVQRWRRRLMMWVSLIIIVPALILGGEHLGFFDASTPLTIPQMLGLIVVGGFYHAGIHLISKKINS
jgi:tetratricopeptide (TPR) repeat protein